MQRANYNTVNSGVRGGLHYGSLIIGLFAIALMCLFAWIVSSMQMPHNMGPFVRIPPVMILVN
jgi:hypothetical protein